MIDTDLTWDCEHTIQCTDDMYQNCAPETYINLLNSVTAINPFTKSINNSNKNHKNFVNVTKGIEDITAKKQKRSK